ncbi:hypothetical protein CAPTEDRAFT_184521 [Capitella teleta]|uniref:Exonuclease domain-containing protein n=1 Tax=Capitella teleta TaxID=283909 RepID=R7UFL8_CAPTE|nr:hypothetical protein CAPTEDRAFT_184521 [Capitella teleta]|eukprot:ELU02067.1 hypothetical protein CAPTEDRAFT_184521 [Capitella teleta]
MAKTREAKKETDESVDKKKNGVTKKQTRTDSKRRKLKAYKAILSINGKELQPKVTLSFELIPHRLPMVRLSEDGAISNYYLPVDVKQLINYSLHGQLNQLPRCCKFIARSLVPKCCLIVVRNLGADDVNYELFPSLKTHFFEGFPMTSPIGYCSTIAEELFGQVPAHKDAELRTVSTHDKFSRTRLLLTPLQMSRERIPMPISNWRETATYAGFQYTKASYDPVTSDSPLLAVDCEMCLTAGGRKELTRVSITDESHNILYDTYVKPDTEIVDYLTRFSGVTEEIMNSCTMTLADVQKDFQRILPADSILCGHSINFDLNALKLFHPYIIDSSTIYNLSGMSNKKEGLKRLSEKFLRSYIQMSDAGHCSKEDASATMKLIQLKLRNDYRFGNVLLNGQIEAPNKDTDLAVPTDLLPTSLRVIHLQKHTDFNTKKEKISSKLFRPNSDPQRNVYFYRKSVHDFSSQCLLETLAQSERRAAIVCHGSDCNAFASKNSSVIEVSCRKQCSKLFRSSIETNYLIYAQMQAAERTQSKLQRLDRTIGRMYDALPKNSLACVVFEGREDADRCLNGMVFCALKR